MIWGGVGVLVVLVGVSFLAGFFVSQVEAQNREGQLDQTIRRLRAQTPEIELNVWVEREGGHPYSRRFRSVKGDLAVRALQRAAQQGGFSYREMNSVLTRVQWDALRDELVEARFLKWVDPHSHRRGVAWSQSGRGLLRAAREYQEFVC